MELIKTIRERKPAVVAISEGSLFPAPSYEVVEIGGHTHYSQEMRCYFAHLPTEQANRIVDEIEYRNRPRKIIRWL